MQTEKRVVSLVVLSLVVISFFSFSIVSAGWFSDIFGRITGNVVSGNSVVLINNSITSGLVGYWPLDGNARDFSGGDNNLSCVNCPTSVSGIVGSSYNFSSGNSLTGLNKNLPLGDSARSISVWIKPYNIANSFILGWGYDSMYKTFSALVYDSRNGRNSFGFVPGGSISVSARQFSELNSWNHIVISYGSQGNLKIYINGIDSGLQVREWDYMDTSSSGNFAIAGKDVFRGLVDEVAIWNRSLSQDEVNYLYNQGNGLSLLSEVSSDGGSSNMTQNATCYDSDGGLNYYVKGNVSIGGNLRGVDFCHADGRVDEAYCYDNFTLGSVEQECPNGCVDGACVNSTQDSCQEITDFMKNPTDLILDGNEWVLNYNYSDSSSYGIYSYVSFMGQDDYSSNYVYVEETELNSVKEAEKNLKYALDDGICNQERIYADETGDYQIIYLCKNIWDLGYDSQEIIKQDDQYSVTAIWLNGNRLFRVYSYRYDYNNCYSYEDCKAQDESQHRNEERQTTEFLQKLVNNENQYVNSGYLDWYTKQFVKYLLNGCNSEVVESEESFSSWSCRMDPVICPPHGKQIQKCTKYNYELEKEETREATISCNPGICSGCILSSWVQNIWSDAEAPCIPYGFRFGISQINEGGRLYISDFQDDPEDPILFDLEVLADGMAKISVNKDIRNITATESDPIKDVTISVNGQKFGAYPGESYIFYEGETYDVSMSVTTDSGKEELLSNGILVRVDDIFDSFEDVEDYIDLTLMEKVNAYCDIDGQVKQQKTQAWGSCQNNYECESNMCSYGECVDLKGIANQVTGFKGFVVKMLCKLGNPFSEDEYLQCVSDNA